MEDEQVSGGRLDQVRVVNLLPVLEPVADPGLGVALGRVAAQLGLAADLDLLRVGWRVELFAQVWKKVFENLLKLFLKMGQTHGPLFVYFCPFLVLRKGIGAVKNVI